MNRFTLLANPVVLSPEGTVFLMETSTLVAADLHLGKSAAFRASGLPVPEGDTARDLARLKELARFHDAAEIVIAGDLFHAPSGVTPELAGDLARFMDGLEMPLHLVAGNHDAKLARLPCGLVSTPSLERGGVRIIHDPADRSSDPVLHLAGHWHPVVKIRDGRRTSLRLPCFLLRENTLVLPSFGSFTGGAVIPDEPGDRIFVGLREKVVELPDALRKRN